MTDRIAVIGSGTMGHGIAHVAGQAGMQVALFDVDSHALERALESVRANLEKGVSKGKVSPETRDATLGRIRLETDLAQAVRDAALVVEAVPEDLELKRSIFRELETLVSSKTVLASNTSSLPVGEIAANAKHPERILGMHFFNPVHLMALLEIVRPEAVTEANLNIAVDAGKQMGKECIVVRDSPGFATSRLGVVLGMEAIRMVEAGVASPEDIDTAMTLGYRHPLGPLRLTDLVGLDVRLAIAEHLYRALESEAFRPPDLLRRMVDEGNLGRKTGKGFYRW